MRRVTMALLGLLAPAMLFTGVATAAAAPEKVAAAVQEAPVAAGGPEAVAEAACTSYTNVYVGGTYYLHVPSLGTDSWNFNCVVVRGHKGWPVLVLQESLNACYGQGLVEDGDFGGNTERAVRNVQAIIGVPVDGRAGPITRKAMLWQAYDHGNGGAHTGWCTHY